MLNAIAKPFGILLLWIYGVVGNYGVAIILFACAVKLILLPFQMKSKKSMMRMSRLSEQLKELEKRHEGNQRAYQEEVAKLYRDEHINPMSGCLWTLIPFPILIALYGAIREPLTTMMGVPAQLLAEGGAIFRKLAELGFDSTARSAYVQLSQSQFISEHFDAFAGLSDRLVNINYNFLGLNIGNRPEWNFFFKCDWSQTSSWLPAFGLFLIPLISGFMSWASMKVSQFSNPSTGSGAQAEAAAQQMKTMNLMMPLFSIYFCFLMPAALGVYWIANSILAAAQELILNRYYRKIMAREDAGRLEREKLREAELERKRQETERLKAEGATTRNANTSKKKLQAKQKAELDELRAAAQRQEKAERRKRLGIPEVGEEKPASQVGNRRYARGRAYVPDRFTNPEAAAEATAAAAAESEFGPSIDGDADDGAAEKTAAAQADGADGIEYVHDSDSGEDEDEQYEDDDDEEDEDK